MSSDSLPTQSLSSWQVITAPARCVDGGSLSVHLRLDNVQYDGGPYTDWGDPNDLGPYVDAAIDYVESTLESSLAPRTIVATFRRVDDMLLPRGPVIRILSVVDRNGSPITDFETETVGRRVRVKVKVNQACAPIAITYTAGYTNAAIDGDEVTPAIPPALRMLVLNYAAMLYENREAASEKPLTPLPHVEAFLRGRRQGTGVG